MASIKVRVTLTLEVDPDAWEDLYSPEGVPIREDVREYAKYLLQESSAAQEGAITRVTSA